MLLVGPVGSGKTTFARARFRPTEVISSDFCRALISDDEGDQSATAAAFAICHALLRSRVGYYWLAIREDEVAARALGINTFRYKMIAIIISAGMTAPAGVFYAFYYNNLFPEQTFFIVRSIEIILGPVIGGVGTLFGPVLGAFLLTGLSEGLQNLTSEAEAYGSKNGLIAAVNRCATPNLLNN